MKESADKEASGHEGDLGGLPLVEEAVAFGGLLQGEAVAEDEAPLEPARLLQGEDLADPAGDVGEGTP